MRAIGIDVHRDFCEVAISEGGQLRSAGRVPSTPEELELLAASLGPDDEVALETTGAIVDHCLDTWTGAMLKVEFERRYGAIRQLHMRRSILLRLLSHDAFHSGEISQLLGANGLPAIDLWARQTT